MSSTGFQQIRRRTNAQTHINALIKEFNRFQAESVQVDNPDFITTNRLTHSRLKYHDPFTVHKVKPVTTRFYLPFEPDANHVVILCKLDHNGRYSEDSSGFGNHGRFINNPIMKQGLDLGNGASLYPYFNGLDMWVYWKDNPHLDAKQIKDYATFTCRIYPEAVDDTDPNILLERHRTILSKTDDDLGVDAYRVAVIPDGSIKFTFARAGIRTTVVTAPGTVKLHDPGAGMDPRGFDSIGFDTTTTAEKGGGYDPTAYDSTAYDFVANPDVPPETYELAFKVDFVSSTVANRPILAIVVHDVLAETITTYTTLTSASSSHLTLINFDTNHRMRVGGFTPFFDGFYNFKGGIQDFRFYKEMLLTSDHLDNLFTNKYTINEVNIGHVALSGYTVVLESATADGGFEENGFEAVGFEVNP